MNDIFKLPEVELEEFVKGYLTCALWSSNDESTPSGGESLDSNYGLPDIAATTRTGVVNECRNFMVAHRGDLLEYVKRRQAAAGHTEWECAGHDFWLTRNHHGAGFWDRGMGTLGSRLEEATHLEGESSIYVGDDGKLYIMGMEDLEESATGE